MTNPIDGYVTDIGYIHGYYAALNPLWMRLAFLNAGLRVPEVANACELGFGQGVSINIHAAASSAHWCGTDFIPAHAGFARQLAAASGADLDLYEDSFEDFDRRADLPAFDYIGLHGVWSWISDHNRAVIVNFVRRRLKPGGVLYIGYNTLPGWANISSIRHLLTEHAKRRGIEGRGIAARIDEAVSFSDRLLATNPTYAKENPAVLDYFRLLKDEDRRYLAHEYFNRDWEPMHFATVARSLEPATVSYACSADFTDHVGALNLTGEQRDLLAEIRDPDFRQTVRDFIINQRFRRDYWVRGVTKLSDPERLEALRKEHVISLTHLTDLPFELRAVLALSNSGPPKAIYAPVLELLADRTARTLGEIEQAVGHRGISLLQIVDTVVLMASCGQLAAAQDDATTARVQKRTDKLNAHLIGMARNNGDITELASPVTGGGIHVGRREKLFLSALRQGMVRPDEWAREVSTVIAAEGAAIDLTEEARAFSEQTLPMLRALRIT